MIATIIELSVKNKFLVILATLFVIAAGIYAIARTPLDAIPDLSDVQVIIFTEYPGQAPQVVEDQVTYPLTTAMLSVPFAKVVRGYSFFGISFVYIIFEDGTDLYWARSRVLEYLNFVAGRLPQGVTPSLGPDATGVGWVYEYILESDRHDLAQLRSIQDWFLRYELASVAGCLRGGLHRRICQAVPGGRGPQQAAGLQHPHPEDPHGHPAQQHGCGRPAGGDGRDRVHGAGAGVYQEHRRPLFRAAEGG
jgi:Cu/Ag efflux pump CusA